MAARQYLLILLAAVLCGCGQLRAERPLFSVADQAGAPPIVEGVWIWVSDECPERHARARGRVPAECSPIDIRRAVDGAWIARGRADLVSGLSAQERAETDEGPYRLVVAPAVERAVEPESFAPLYIVEMTRVDAPDGVTYFVVAPSGAMPATAFSLLPFIGCEGILRDGPIEGVTVRYMTRTDPDGSEHQEIRDCLASNQAAVREAARRAVVESVGEMSRSRLLRWKP